MPAATMGPAELAALVAREADAGVSGALAALDAAGALRLESVVGRVASVPRDDAVAWDEVVWEAEFVMTATGDSPAEAPGAGRPAAPADVPALLATLPVTALRGVGPAWGRWLAARGVGTVADLAVAGPATVTGWLAEAGGLAPLVARARACLGSWPSVDPGDGRRVADVLRAGPGEGREEHELWHHCLGLAGAFDDAVLDALPIAVSAR